MPALLLVGCGDIALRLAPLLANRFALSGLRRHPDNLPACIQPLQGDVCDPASLARALGEQVFDYVVITLTPGERSEARYRQVYVEGVQHLLRVLVGQPRLLFVSSTSVYGQHQGEWVNEQSPATGDGFSGRILLEAERLVVASGLPASRIRFSGIYGRGRERLMRRVREALVDPAQAGQYSNRIHADDAARVLAFLLHRWTEGQIPAPCYVASDTRPVQAGHVWQWLAAQLAVTPPRLPADWETAAPAGKRCDSTLLQTAGFTFLYPDFCAGYSALLAG